MISLAKLRLALSVVLFIVCGCTRSFLTVSPVDEAAVLLAVRTVDRRQIFIIRNVFQMIM